MRGSKIVDKVNIVASDGLDENIKYENIQLWDPSTDAVKVAEPNAYFHKKILKKRFYPPS